MCVKRLFSGVCQWVLLDREIRQQGELPFITKVQKQSAATAGGSIFSFPFHFCHPCHSTHTHTNCTYSNMHPRDTWAYIQWHFMHIHIKQIDNSQSGHCKTHTHTYLDFIFKEGLRHRRPGAEGGEESQMSSSPTTANLIPRLHTQT